MSYVSLEERLWANIDTSGGPEACWPWKAGCSGSGYPTMKVSGKTVSVHRLVANAAEGEHVRHACDNPPCCNPTHLIAGTRAENMADMAAKGRSTKGERHWAAKLTGQQVVAIFKDPRKGVEIAKDYEIRTSLVSRIKNRKIWVHVLHGTEETY